MSTTIQKRADELKPGDVWLIRPASRYVVLAAIQEEPGADVELTTCGVAVGEEAGMRDRVTHSPSRLFEIEAPALTPAQQHAEELAEFLRTAVTTARQGARRMPQWAIDADALLQTFEPPEPPTLEEALHAIADMREYDLPRTCKGKADDILDRARRAGLLKGGA